MFSHVLPGARLKVYVLGGADFTGTYQPILPDPALVTHWVELVASNGKVIRIDDESVVAVVEL